MDSLISVLHSISLVDVLDVVIVTLIFYSVLNMFKKTRAFQVIAGLILFFIVYILAVQIKLKTLTFLIESLMQVGFIALIIVFQPELRRALEQAGNAGLSSIGFLVKKTAEQEEAEKLRKAIAAICDGVERMSEEETGALIVMEKFIGLSRITNTGTPVNSDITSEIIGTIFYEGTPLHDGAMVIHDGRITHAGCLLPLSDNLEISKDLGTRHRAALGLSEVSDAIILVVSEETGIISYAKNGVITRNMDRQSLYEVLDTEFIKPIMDAEEKNRRTGIFRRRKNEKEKV